MVFLRSAAETQALNNAAEQVCSGIETDKKFCKKYGISRVMAGMHMDGGFTCFRVYSSLMDRLFIQLDHDTMTEMTSYAIDMAKADIAYKLASGMR